MNWVTDVQNHGRFTIVEVTLNTGDWEYSDRYMIDTHYAGSPPGQIVNAVVQMLQWQLEQEAGV